LAEEITKNIDNVTIEYIKGSGGDFEVVKDGQVVFSKRKEGRFPEPSEIVVLLS